MREMVLRRLHIVPSSIAIRHLCDVVRERLMYRASDLDRGKKRDEVSLERFAGTEKISTFKSQKVTGSFSRMIHKPFIEHRLQVSRSDDTNPSERGRIVASKLATLKKETKSSFRVERSPRLQRIGARG